MGTSRRSKRIKERKKVAKGSPSKTNKQKQTSEKNGEEGRKKQSSMTKEKSHKPVANAGTEPTGKCRRKGEDSNIVDLMNEDNEKWEGHLDRAFARDQRKPKANPKNPGTKTKNAFDTAIATGVIRIGNSDSDSHGSDVSEEIIFENEISEVPTQKEGPMGKDNQKEKDNKEDEASMEEDEDEDDENPEMSDSSGEEGDEESDDRTVANRTVNMEEGTKTSRLVAFVGEADEDDLGLDELENEDEGIMGIDEDETPAGVFREMKHPDILMECRYSLIITTKPSTKPYKSLRDQIVSFLQALKEQIGDKVYVCQWDPDGAEEVEPLKKPEDLPKLTALTRSTYAAYFNAYPNPKRNEETTYFWRVRLMTSEPESLPVPLTEIGQSIYDESEEGIGVSLGRNPYPCQAVKTATLGWLFGSTKTIRSDTFVPALREKLGIPDHVCVGVQWRTLKNERKKQYVWNNDDHPPQALHIKIDYEYANRFFNEAAKIFKKKSRKRILGMRLRIVPCTASERAKAMTTIQKENVLLMAAKQQYLTNSFISRIESSHILNLDRPVGRLQITLRKYLMSRAPKNSVVERIFMTVDPAWKGKGHVLITTKPHYQEALEILNNMIPECIHNYGPIAAHTWFSNTGLEAYRGVKWDPKKKSTTSNRDHESISLVAEDIFGLGTEWKLEAPILQKNKKRDESFVNDTVIAALDKRADDSSVHSLGSIFGRSHEGDTIASVKQKATEKDEQEPAATIQFVGIENIIANDKEPKDDDSPAGTSAAFTTDSVRAKLRDTTAENEQIRREYKELEARLQERSSAENESVATEKTTQSTRAKYYALSKEHEKNAAALAAKEREIEELQKALRINNGSNKIPPSPNPKDTSEIQTAPAPEEQAAATADGGGEG